ncbi:MAG: lysoplasmalogenase [Actinomycetota bacterium]
MRILLPALILAICDWVAVATGVKKLEYVFKPLTLLAVIVTAFYAGVDHTVSGAGETPELRTWYFILAALAFSLLGDIFLMLPSDRFVPGLAAFLLAHICYVGAFNASFGHYRTYAVGAAVAVVSAMLFLRVRRGMVQKGQTKLLVPVALYVIAITVMVTAAVGTSFTPATDAEVVRGTLVRVDARYERAAPAAALGAILFYVSDALIGWTRFVRDFTQSRLAIMVTYHLGQMGFVVYVLRN